uniref:WGS project CAEQ00000000 data, annotated contig 336 n=1 Tax=Trypanosoma congolense (strain IL3000) TaxID=1068625 RepID=F9WF14_TRYCI|nr:unnamed protein product [Trypanosoma congolense IL3000]
MRSRPSTDSFVEYVCSTHSENEAGIPHLVVGQNLYAQLWVLSHNHFRQPPPAQSFQLLQLRSTVPHTFCGVFCVYARGASRRVKDADTRTRISTLIAPHACIGPSPHSSPLIVAVRRSTINCTAKTVMVRTRLQPNLQSISFQRENAAAMNRIFASPAYEFFSPC